MVHLRIVVPPGRTDEVLEELGGNRSVCNVILLPGAGIDPPGDVILCDVAPEDASVVVADLKVLKIHHAGSIALEQVDSQVSRGADAAVAHAHGSPADAVVWEEVEARTSEGAELSWSHVIFMAMAGIIAACGILLDSSILIVGAMVVSPDFGPVAGVCVGVVNRRPQLALRSLLALAVGVPTAITVAWLFTVIGRATGLMPETFSDAASSLASIISAPDAYSLIVAASAGVVGIMSLTSAKSGALIGVLISVTTIPAAANIGVSFAYQDWSSWRGSQIQLAANITMLLVSGILTLAAQRALYERRLARHLRDRAAAAAGVTP
ncbi:DUF389 domain-containing protein [Svornostia abyssi]|uniref:DUF389 domain-containing protein n=1 Tax=Svornostia abyssi TaxID=2898438 RepID=A0ABY5PCQ4_9ACTN|nr:DUF389 domain-containing protein [Parviterribacteraceae bacterium J379]